VRRVSGEDRVSELARMMAGTGSEAALEHARDLLADLGRSIDA
jgi:DNA repair protein RecN (Recombination protein N)